jgi:pimeloyl-ACP methyl ester carboxylesterase
MKILLIFIAIAAFIHILRIVLASKVWSPPPGDDFNGVLMSLGDNLVCLPDRSHLSPAVVSQTTLVCFPGFLEDVRYFLEVHHNTPARLIIINNANYQNPLNTDVASIPDWYKPNPYSAGTIAHDAYCLNQVLENMTATERVVLHGHSRGGAVVLEAGNQQPGRAQGLEAILEAAVVPRGRLAGNQEKLLQPVGFYLFPFILAVMRILPKSRRLKSPMMWVSTPAKEKNVLAIPFTPRQYATAVINSADIINWQASTAYDSYDHFNKVTLFVGQRDSVLWRAAMIKSAEKSDAVTVIETTGTDHFISLEKPDLIRDYF